MTKQLQKKYVTVQTVVVANSKLVNNSATGEGPRVTPLGKPLPPTPSRDALAAAGARALQSLKQAH